MEADRTKPHIDLLKEGPARGMWRCRAKTGKWTGACFGHTPAEAYARWKAWGEGRQVKPPFVFLGVGA